MSFQLFLCRRKDECELFLLIQPSVLIIIVGNQGIHSTVSTIVRESNCREKEKEGRPVQTAP